MEGLTESSVRSMNVSELKEELSKRNLAVTGKKAELLGRLLDDLSGEEEVTEEVKEDEEAEQESEAPEVNETAVEATEGTNEEEQMETTEENSGEEQMETTEGTSQDAPGPATVEAAKLVHPHLETLSAFKPNEWQLQKQTPQPPVSLEDAGHTFIDTIALLQEMVTTLNKEKEIGVALQHSSSTTFLPTCHVLQISTRNHDYIVDVKALRDDLKALNEILANETVLKVMSRQNYDLEVLAEHCGLWIVNLFDVWTAGRLLNDGVAQGNMLQKYCSVENVHLDHKTNDWTTRPLSEEQLKHTRMKVRYLPYLHDVLRNELMEKKLLDKLYDECTSLCKKSADRGHLGNTEKTWRKLYKKNKKSEGVLNPKQMQCFSLLCNWGYTTAKKLNKSLSITLPIPTMFKIARKLPLDAKGIAVLYPNGVLPPQVEGNVQDLLRVIRQSIKEAKKQGMADLKAKWGYGGRGRPFIKRGNPPMRGYGMHLQRGSGMAIRGPGMGPRRPGMVGPMGPGMGPMGAGMGPMGPGMGPMGAGMGLMGPMGFMGPPMGHTGPRMGYMGPTGLRDLIDKFVDETVQGAGYGNNYGPNNRGGGGGFRGRGRGRAQGGKMRGRR